MNPLAHLKKQYLLLIHSLSICLFFLLMQGSSELFYLVQVSTCLQRRIDFG